MLMDCWLVVNRATPWAFPSLLVFALLGVVGGLLLGGRQGTSWWSIAAVTVSPGAIIGYALTPDSGSSSLGMPRCASSAPLDVILGGDR